jgi:hypothetical protein
MERSEQQQLKTPLQLPFLDLNLISGSKSNLPSSDLTKLMGYDPEADPTRG